MYAQGCAFTLNSQQSCSLSVQCTLRTSYREIIISHLLLTRHQTYPMIERSTQILPDKRDLIRDMEVSRIRSQA